MNNHRGNMRYHLKNYSFNIQYESSSRPLTLPYSCSQYYLYEYMYPVLPRREIVQPFPALPELPVRLCRHTDSLHSR